MTEWICIGCGARVDAKAPDKPRQPCPQCGSTARTARVATEASVIVNAYSKRHSKHRDGAKKVVREVIEGDDYHRKTGKWNIMRRIIDRTHDWYEEHFTDRKTGETLHQTGEPLSEHHNLKKTRA